MAATPEGAVFTGYTSSPTQFGATKVGGSDFDEVVVATDPVGAVRWARAIPTQRRFGTKGDWGQKLGVDGAGNIYITGSFVKPLALGAYTLTSSGAHDAYVAKLTKAGEWAWAIHLGGAADDEGWSIAVAKDGTSYVAGTFTGTAQIESLTATASGREGLFVMAIDEGGTPLWLKAFGGAGFSDIQGGIARSATGKLVIGGSYAGTMALGSTELTARGERDVFVALLDDTGTPRWAKTVGAKGRTDAHQIIAASGAIYLAGQMGEQLVAGEHTLDGGKGRTGFITRFDEQGGAVWAKVVAPMKESARLRLAASAADLVVAGTFSEKLTLADRVLQSHGGRDVFVARYTPAGDLRGALSVGGAGFDSLGGVQVIDARVYAALAFSGDVELASTTQSAPADHYRPCLWSFDVDELAP